MEYLYLNKEPIRILDPWQEDILSGGMIFLGVILCVSGEIWFNTLVAVIAAIAGGMAMNLFLIKLHADVTLTALGIMIVFASVTCGAIASQVKSIAIWLAGALAGLLVANLIYAELLDKLEMQDQDWAHLLTILVSALLCGTLLSWLERPLERVITSFVGSYLCVAGISHILKRTKVAPGEPFWPSQFFGDVQHFECKDDSTCMALLATWMACFLAGVVWQTCTNIIYEQRRYRDGYQEI